MIALVLFLAADPVLTTRDLANLPYKEMHVTAHTTLTTTELHTFFMGRFLKMGDPKLKRTVLTQTPTRAVVYDRITMPVGSDRDYVLEFNFDLDTQTKVLEVRFRTLKKDDVPICEGCVRMTDVHGSWMLAPADQGGTDLHYTVYSDPGGDFPRFMVASKQGDAALTRVRKLLEQASEK